MLRRANLFDIGVAGKIIIIKRIDGFVKENQGFRSTYSNLRPISRLASKTVFRGFIAA